MEICFFQILRSLHVNSTSPCFPFGFFFFKRAPHHSLLSPSPIRKGLVSRIWVCFFFSWRGNRK